MDMFDLAISDAAISWANFAALVISSYIFTVYYVKSVRPAALEKEIGLKAYEYCKWYRIVSGVFMTVASINCLLFGYYPLPGLPPSMTKFRWTYSTSVKLAVAVTVPCGYLMWVGMRDAGEETMSPKKEHGLYSGGIYEHMRHPQAVGEFPLWATFALLAHSPFMLFFTFVYGPIWYYFAVAEEEDLVLRYGNAYEEYRKRVGIFPKIISSGTK